MPARLTPLCLIRATEGCRFESLPHLFRAFALAGAMESHLTDQTYLLDSAIIWG